MAKPLADVNRAWTKVAGRVAAGTGIGLLVAFILATFVARRITRPLKELGAAADRVARGDLEVHVAGDRTADDELGQLAHRFQGMVDRLREVDELERNFLMRVTHELRTPVTAISGHVQAMNEGLVGPEDMDTSLDAVSEEVRRIGRLVDDLLDLTRLEAHQFRLVREEVGLEALLEQAAASFRDRARANEVSFDTPDRRRAHDPVGRRPGAADRVQPARQRLPLDAPQGHRHAQLRDRQLDRRDPHLRHRTRHPGGRPGRRLPPVLQPPRRGRHRPWPFDRTRAGARPRRPADRRQRGRPGHHLHAVAAVQPPERGRSALMRYRLCDTAQDVSGICVELELTVEPFADEVPYALSLHAGGLQVAQVERGALTPAELFALGHALLDAAADGFGHFVPADEVFGLDLAPPSVPVALHEVGVTVWVDAGRAAATGATRSGVAVQLVIDAPSLAMVAESVCDDAARVLSR